ncbi:MAG: 23S rRNA (guanosine(2251)-2'-O)-methyltransferase RlmB, partial [Clostridia bacterium]|nr:23S rRNA (guanosine(2251)-2'-O)-methyltransferase RlmB [Clostridia bacterium]
MENKKQPYDRRKKALPGRKKADFGNKIETADSSDKIIGRNPVMEALRSGRTIDKIIVQNGEKHGSILKILAIAKEKRIAVSYADKAKLDKISDGSSHQGVVAYVAAKEYVSVQQILKIAADRGEHPFIVI